MARQQTYEAVVLKSVDIGEADRFCVLFTRERGRVAARAKGVRKQTSRMGGSLQLFSHVRVELVETESSFIITSASALGHHLLEYGEFDVFKRLQQGIELLLALTEDDEPLPDVFDAVLTFLHAAVIPECDPVLPFALRLLHLLGLLPSNTDDQRFARLSPEAQAFVKRCVAEDDLDLFCSAVPDSDTLWHFVDLVLAEHMQKPLKSWR